MASTMSLASANDGWLQSNVRVLGSYASTSTPSYALSALFALSTPFGFASPAQAAAEAAAKQQHQQQVARASEAAASRGSSSLVARLVANVQSNRSAASHAPVRTLPPFWQLAFFAAAFGTGGYMIDQGDHLNGSGVVTAWSLTYLLFKTVPVARQLPRNPLAMSLSVAVLTLGLGVHGSHYFDQTSWKGAVPSLGARVAETDGAVKRAVEKRPTSIFASTQPVQSRGVLQDSSLPKTGRGSTNNDLARTAAFHFRRGDAPPAHAIEP
ncbi:uncharacterized protein PAN0_098d6702 [Moesziomyces antarcticus]|uniref:Uncharacterized protein n=2 Tax=Pseudozyma antarctica TaxID=84753 RepID=A0A081CP50_PSEA2|nr:uncharacterized protein PAN0_098d6702 [Moesziomyces antarcticus]GAK68446.1 conserved hypothetical protein [Moesziomyces antarcticus]